MTGRTLDPKKPKICILKPSQNLPDNRALTCMQGVKVARLSDGVLQGLPTGGQVAEDGGGVLGVLAVGALAQQCHQMGDAPRFQNRHPVPLPVVCHKFIIKGR